MQADDGKRGADAYCHKVGSDSVSRYVNFVGIA